MPQKSLTPVARKLRANQTENSANAALRFEPLNPSPNPLPTGEGVFIPSIQ